jgi:hypothetical protein
LKYLHYIFLILCSFNCSRNREISKEIPAKVIATAGNEHLGAEDFSEQLITTGIIKDSAYNARKTIEKWAGESLFYQEALKKLDDEDLDIEGEVLEYRKSLLNYIYQGKIIEANLDTNISEEEIVEYYNNHRDNFILKENIVKVNYLKIPVRAPALQKIRNLLGSQKPKDKELFATLVSQNAENSYMNDSTWLYFDDIKKEIPRLNEQEALTVSAGRVFEFTDEQYYYYLKIKDIKIKNGISPLNFERKNIRKFIINNRKVILIQRYKQTLIEKAKGNKTFVVF